MSNIDLNHLLKDISPEAPSGEQDLAEDPAFIELGIKINGTPEVEFDGKIVQEAKGPNWREVQEAAVELLTRSHDLRVAMSLTQAMVHSEGIHGISSSLEFLHGLVGQYWDTLYPQLEPDDNNDPTQRINILVALSEGEDIIGPLTRANLCTPAVMGQFSLRDIHIASGKIAPAKNDKDPPPSMSNIEAAFKECDVEDLLATQAAIGASRQSLSSLDKLLIEKVGPDNTPQFAKLNEIFQEMEAFMEKQLEGRSVAQPVATAPSSESAVAGDPQPVESVSSQAEWPAGAINNRQDVIRCLDQICMYYQQNEPGSPVPLLLNRARRLVDRDFFEIMQDFGLDSAAPIKTLFSGDEEDSS